MDYEEMCSRAVMLTRRGTELAMAFADSGPPQAGSHVAMLKHLQTKVGSGTWLEDDIDFLCEGLKGLIGIAGAQLDGHSGQVASGPPVLLHPLVTVVRGVAEACGTVAFLISPWIIAPGGRDEGTEEDWCRSSEPTLARVELLQLEARISRVRRLRAGFTNNAEGLKAAQDALDVLRLQLEGHHGVDNVEVRGSLRYQHRIYDEVLPSKTTLVTQATEYAYGAGFVGKGINPYPMLSGFAHADLEILFSQAPLVGRPNMSSLFAGEANEVRDVVVLGCRLLAAHYEMAAMSFGYELSELRVWEEEIRLYIEETA